ncbi:MAG TPA: hypothetical protein PLJ98_01620 [Acholeplasmataceae bacterium]|nr:hypothetical protein [Acholeplasmataceae bacterium]HRX45077.1 hypothetical protein [Acholeplasmataceae bacterium]
MDESKRKNVILYAVAYLTIIDYMILLIILMYAYDRLDTLIYTTSVFGSGALISIITSTFVIRKYKLEEFDFPKAIIYLAICHMPVIIGLILSLLEVI